MKRIAFIINPISGTKNKDRLPSQISRILDPTVWQVEVLFTEYAGHAHELAKQKAQEGYEAVVAVGGDGTVNEVASALRDTQTALGIIPIGSGNGFARHLHIPMRVTQALRLINEAETIACDYGMVDDRPFFCTCGTGFDAYIADRFAKAGKRGLVTYAKQTVQEAFHYQPEQYRLVGEGIDVQTPALLITFANANQWGNDAQIAPHASLQDGQMEIAIMSRFPMIAAPDMAIRLFTRTMHKSHYVHMLHTDRIRLIREKEGPFHFDGDPHTLGCEINIRIVRAGLRVLVSPKHTQC